MIFCERPVPHVNNLQEAYKNNSNNNNKNKNNNNKNNKNKNNNNKNNNEKQRKATATTRLRWQDRK